MYDLSKILRTIVAQPYRTDNATYVEVLPCKQLQPFVHCFWGSYKPYIRTKSNYKNITRVIPDICTDIIYNIDYSKNKIYSNYCELYDSAIVLNPYYDNALVSTFSIRFHLWGAILFTDNIMNNSTNNATPVQEYFNDLHIENMLFELPYIKDRIKVVETYLLKKLDITKANNNVMNCIYKMIESNGKISIGDLTSYSIISTRQMERNFRDTIGLSPKKIANLIRYQFLWQDVVSGCFIINEAIEKYGFYDQAHLLNYFKKYHGLNIKDALNYTQNMNSYI